MPKKKSHRGAAKRFKKTGTGLFKRSQANKSHILEKKSPKRKRQLRGTIVVNATEQKNIKKLLPYI